MEEPLKNLRQERFAQLMAAGVLSQTQCFIQSGYSEASASTNAAQLAKQKPVASRIAWLRSQAALPSSKQTSEAITRQELADLLSKVIKAGWKRPEQARPYDAQKAADLLAKLQGWHEAEKVQHSHQHIHVDAGLIEQLRAGYSALADRQQGRLAAPLPGEGQQEGRVREEKTVPPTPTPGDPVLYIPAE